MKATFADTCYYLALLNADDALHEAAVDLSKRVSGTIVTTAWVLTEVADALSRPHDRVTAARFIRELRSSRRVTTVPPDQTLFEAGFELYARRPDKNWSLTDCTSFVVMKKLRLAEALTADVHFRQAGFKTLLT
jgi:predicted nucleic acid-binding protein